MAIGKSLRFEVFARDGYTCQYCGARPPDVVLELDHIHPRAKGGSDEITNLITACFDCNRGKRDKVLTEVSPRPDSDLAFLKVQQEIAEIKRYTETKQERDRAVKEVCDDLRETWEDYLTDTTPTHRVIAPWVLKYGPREVEEAIICAARPYTNNQFGSDDRKACISLIPYVSGILRNRNKEGA